MSRRTINLSIIVLGIILLNSLAFIGAGADPLSGASLPGNTANHAQGHAQGARADLQTQASAETSPSQAWPSRSNHHLRNVDALQRQAGAQTQPASVAAAIGPMTGSSTGLTTGLITGPTTGDDSN